MHICVQLFVTLFKNDMMNVVYNKLHVFILQASNVCIGIILILL